jgi:thiamine biosynthesis lipoprotein
MTRPLPRLVLVASLVLLTVTAVRAEPSERSRWLMGTLFTFRADGPAAAAALPAALDHVASLEAHLSNWSATSELSRLNAAGAADEVSEPLCAVLDSALALARLTEGAFDPTVEPLTRAWDLRGSGRVPDAREREAARARVDWRRVRLEGARVSLGGAALDLGGIGKGFALDRAADVLRARGVTAASLDAGGQRLELGDAAWTTWVAHPERRESPAVRVALRGGSLSTSAQSEHFVRAGGRHIGHVVDPRTGEPLATRASVSVWAANGTRADALSTAMLVLGRDRAAAFARAHPSIGVLWLEPVGHRLRAKAWNLRILEVASDVDVITPSPAASPLSSLPGHP